MVELNALCQQKKGDTAIDEYPKKQVASHK
jgi:hypothetical protein